MKLTRADYYENLGGFTRKARTDQNCTRCKGAIPRGRIYLAYRSQRECMACANTPITPDERQD